MSDIVIACGDVWDTAGLQNQLAGFDPLSPRHDLTQYVILIESVGDG